MDYRKLVEGISITQRSPLSNKLIDFVLTSKNDEKMPSQLANTMLHHWQNNTLNNEFGLATLLEAALLLEPEKTINIFTELQMTNIAEQIKEALKP